MINFRVFALGHEFVGRAKLSGGSPGRLSGPPEDCYPAEDPDVEIDEISMRLGTRERELEFDSMSAKAQDRIISDIIEDYGQGE